MATEVTTPFLNLIMMGRLIKQTTGAVYALTQVLFVSLWIVFRLGLAGSVWWSQYRSFAVIFETLSSPVIFWVYLLAVPFFNFLNWWWFTKIIKGVCVKPRVKGKFSDEE